MRAEAYPTSEGVVEIVFRQRDGAQGITMKMEMHLSEASKLADRIKDAVRTFSEKGN